MSQGIGIGFSIGFVMFWNRSLIKLPEGWVICDGTSYELNIKEINYVDSNNKIELSNTPSGDVIVTNPELVPGDYTLVGDVVTFKAPIKKDDKIEMKFMIKYKTPNLIGKMIYGGTEAGDTGGSTSHTHGNTGSTTLTVAQIPSHSHTYSLPGTQATAVTSGTGGLTFRSSSVTSTNSGTAGSGSGHVHSTASADHMPPYYTLIPVCFIGFEE